MTALFDMHVHTLHSPDAVLSETELAERAFRAGLSGLGFVDHLDFHPLDPCYGSFRGESYLSAVRDAGALHSGLEVRCGVEAGEPHLHSAMIGAEVEGLEFDFITGALHWVDDRLILSADGFSGGDWKHVVRRYYETTLEMVAEGHFQILAHMGLFRRGMALAGLDTSFDETELWPDLLSDVLGAVISRGIILEVNTSGLRRKEKVTYPARPVLELYRSMGGDLVTLGSDTHSDPWVFFGLEEGARLLRRTGFDACYRPSRSGRPTQCSLLSR